MATISRNVGYTEPHQQVKRIYWGAILAGTVVMLVVMMLLNLLGIGIGLSTINPVTEQQPFSGLGTGAIVWWIVSNLIAIFAGGYIAAKMSGIPRGFNAIMHGLVSWGVYTIVSAWLLTSTVGSVISGVGSILTNTISSITQAVNVEVPTQGGQQTQQQGQQGMFSTAQLANQLENVVETSVEKGSPAYEQVDVNINPSDVNNILQQVFYDGQQLNLNVTRNEVENALIKQTSLSEPQATAATDYLMNKYDQVKQVAQQTEQKSQKAVENASTAALWTFAALAFGAIVAGAGGKAGENKGILYSDKKDEDITS